MNGRRGVVGEGGLAGRGGRRRSDGLTQGYQPSQIARHQALCYHVAPLGLAAPFLIAGYDCIDSPAAFCLQMLSQLVCVLVFFSLSEGMYFVFLFDVFKPNGNPPPPPPPSSQITKLYSNYHILACLIMKEIVIVDIFFLYFFILLVCQMTSYDITQVYKCYLMHSNILGGHFSLA